MFVRFSLWTTLIICLAHSQNANSTNSTETDAPEFVTKFTKKGPTTSLSTTPDPYLYYDEIVEKETRIMENATANAEQEVTYNCTMGIEEEVIQALPLLRRRNIVREEFQELGSDVYFGVEKLNEFTDYYDELTRLETEIANLFNCIAQQERWSIFFWRKLQRFTANRKLNQLRRTLSEVRKIYFETCKTVDKDMNDQYDRYDEMQRLVKQMTSAERLMNLEQLTSTGTLSRLDSTTVKPEALANT